MEVRKISQGGQNSFDNISTKIDSNKVTLVDVSNAQQGDPVIKSQEKDTSNTGTNDKGDNPNKKEIQKALDKLTGFLAGDNTSVEYKYHSTFKNDLMITIIDKNTNQVLLEVPPRKILDLVAKMMEMVGVLFDKKA